MDDEATQPGTTPSSYPFSHLSPHNLQTEAYDPFYTATQIVVDPRRLGKRSSGLSDEDAADIFCILHPASNPAIRACALIAQTHPQDTIGVDSVEVKFKDGNDDGKENIGTVDFAIQGLGIRDIALRLSADVKDPLCGFLFGRNQQRCDFVVRDEGVRRISNVHFRIYINEHGVIMLEDQSTNGTAVDGHLLRAKEKENGKTYRHTLEQGSIVTLTMTPPEEDFKFIVRIPQRDDEDEAAYQQNLTSYFLRLNNIKRERHARLAATAGNKEPVSIKLCLHNAIHWSKLISSQDDIITQRSVSVGRTVKEWRGGAKYNRVGVIGKGAFAVILKVTDKFNGVPYAAKELEKRRFMKNGILDQKIDTEMKIMRKIAHV